MSKGLLELQKLTVSAETNSAVAISCSSCNSGSCNK